MRRPSFFQVTFTLAVPANETSSLRGFPFSQETSRSFFTKWTGSDRSKAVVSCVKALGTGTDWWTQQTFDRQVNWTALLASGVQHLAGVLSCMEELHSVQHQSGNVLLQRNVAAATVHHLFGSSEPLHLQRGAAPHFSTERHAVARQSFLGFWCLHEGWRFWST